MGMVQDDCNATECELKVIVSESYRAGSLKTIHTINLLTYNRSFPINEGDTKWRRECEREVVYVT